MSDEQDTNGTGEIKPAASSRLGKEAKIGVTVIVVLLIVFGIAVGMRLRGSSASDKLAATNAASGQQTPDSASKTDALLKGTDAKLFSSNLPTVVSAKAAAAQPPRSPAGDSDQWKLASDRAEPKRTNSGSSTPNTPPSFMPDPLKSSAADRREPITRKTLDLATAKTASRTR